MKDLVFASSNTNKFDEARDILNILGVNLRYRSCEIAELQTTDVIRLVRQKCLDAYLRVGRPLIVEHTTLHSLHYGGFPGGLTSVLLKTVGLDGASDLLGQSGKNKAMATTHIAYTDGKKISLFDWSAPIGWSSLNVSAWSASGLLA